MPDFRIFYHCEIRQKKACTLSSPAPSRLCFVCKTVTSSPGVARERGRIKTRSPPSSPLRPNKIGLTPLMQHNPKKHEMMLTKFLEWLGVAPKRLCSIFLTAIQMFGDSGSCICGSLPLALQAIIRQLIFVCVVNVAYVCYCYCYVHVCICLQGIWKWPKSWLIVMKSKSWMKTVT